MIGGDEAAQVDETATATPRPGSWLEIEGVEAEMYEGTLLRNRLVAASAQADMDNMTIILNDTTTTLYDDKGWTARLYAAQGRLYLDAFSDRGIGKHDIDMIGGDRGVILSARNGTRIKTPFIRYDHTNKQIFSGMGQFEKLLKLEKGWLLVTGGWFRANQDLTQFDDYVNVWARGVPGPDDAPQDE